MNIKELLEKAYEPMQYKMINSYGKDILWGNSYNRMVKWLKMAKQNSQDTFGVAPEEAKCYVIDLLTNEVFELSDDEESMVPIKGDFIPIIK